MLLRKVHTELLCPNWTQAEGFILGAGAKMFTIAGPVIVYGTVASVVYGIIYWIATLF
jgi:stage V sporulation protein AC